MKNTLGRYHLRTGLVLIFLVGSVLTGCGDSNGESTADETSEPEGAEETSTPVTEAETETEAAGPFAVRVGYNPFFTHAPLSVARQIGTYEDAGVEAEYVQVETPPDAVNAILAGDLDVAVVPPTVLLSVRERGAEIVAIATTSTGSTVPPLWGYAVRRDSGIDTVADLEGKSVGVNNFGGNFDIHLRHKLQQEGLEPEGDVGISVVNLAVAVQALLENQVDAAALTTSGILFIQNQHADELKVLFSNEDIEGVDYESEYNVLVLVASEEWIGQNRDAALAFMEAYVAAVEFIQEQPDEAKRLWAEDTGVDAWGALEQMASFPEGAKVSPTGLEFDMQLMLEFGYLSEEQTIEDAIDNSLVEEVTGG